MYLFTIIVLSADGFDVTANVHADLNFGLFWFDCFKEIGENYFGDGFVEDFNVAEGIDVEFEGF